MKGKVIIIHNTHKISSIFDKNKFNYVFKLFSPNEIIIKIVKINHNQNDKYVIEEFRAFIFLYFYDNKWVFETILFLINILTIPLVN